MTRPSRSFEGEIETNNLNGIGSNIWKLCKATNSLIQDNLCWVPSKVKHLDIWKYGIIAHGMYFLGH